MVTTFIGKERILIDEDTHLRLFNEDDAEEFYQLIIGSKTYLKEWLGYR